MCLCVCGGGDDRCGPRRRGRVKGKGEVGGQEESGTVACRRGRSGRQSSCQHICSYRRHRRPRPGRPQARGGLGARRRGAAAKSAARGGSGAGSVQALCGPRRQARGTAPLGGASRRGLTAGPTLYLPGRGRTGTSPTLGLGRGVNGMATVWAWNGDSQCAYGPAQGHPAVQGGPVPGGQWGQRPWVAGAQVGDSP